MDFIVSSSLNPQYYNFVLKTKVTADANFRFARVFVKEVYYSERRIVDIPPVGFVNNIIDLGTMVDNFEFSCNLFSFKLKENRCFDTMLIIQVSETSNFPEITYPYFKDNDEKFFLTKDYHRKIVLPDGQDYISIFTGDEIDSALYIMLGD